MTLTELAKELNKLVDIKYVTFDEGYDRNPVISGFDSKPYFDEKKAIWTSDPEERDPVISLDASTLKCELDVSEYFVFGRSLDYSKCIVEVE